VIDETAHGRTLWRCRRGMLELDLFLQRFLERDYPHLTDREQAAFARLLDIPDPELLDYCNGVIEPRDPEWQALVRKIAAR
jgi:antitoxin CptB